jgi:signal transduction histidine kinase
MASAIRLSYHKRLFLLLLAFSWAMILCFAVFQYYREKQCKTEVFNGQLQMYNHHLLDALEGDLYDSDYLEKHEEPFNEQRITIVDFSGKVLYDDTVPLDSLDNHLKRPEIAKAMKSGKDYHIGRQSASDGRLYFYSATKGKHIIVRTAIPYNASLRELLKGDWAFLWSIFIFSIVMSVLAYFATRRLGNTIERLNRFAAKAENGESFDDEKPFPNDELGSISNHIVQLYAQWQQTVKDRDIEHESAMREEHEKIRIKRQLTNNINHELKTPVASMQVCLETLLSGIKLNEEQQHELLERCYVNNDRLRRLLADVSLITRVEDGGQLIGRETVVVNKILEDLAAEMEATTEEQHMALHLDIKDQIVVYGNLSLLYSIFRNLTENAIAYSGGKNIYITLLEHSQQRYLIRFEDDGCGVANDQLPRLFERFYRVDKGRCRQKGGTGLGLSIVKHAVLFHGGIITVSNRPEGGLRFDFTLKDIIPFKKMETEEETVE